MDTREKLIVLASKLMIAITTDNQEEIIKISSELAATKEFQTDGKPKIVPKNDENETVLFLKFTQKEISKMPTRFRKLIRLQGCTVHCRRRKLSRVNTTYELRYRRDGYNISVTSTDLEKAKQKFIDKLNEIENGIDTTIKVPTNFTEFTNFYFENFRKRKVARTTYKNDLNRLKHYLFPAFGNMNIKNITPIHCQKLIDEILSAGKGKTADEIYSLLNSIFKSAINHYIITKNPMTMVYKERHQRKHGTALSKAEEKLLLETYAGTPFQLMFAVAVYTGMRPNEYKTARIEGNFIISVNSKRKNGKVEYKKIPICPMLRPYINDVDKLQFCCYNIIKAKFNDVFSNHHLYDLRTTFYTRCQECGVAEVALKEFVGHSLGGLADTYTTLSDEFLLKESEKIKYILP